MPSRKRSTYRPSTRSNASGSLSLDVDFVAPRVLAFAKVAVTAVFPIPLVLELRFPGDQEITIVLLEVFDQ